ncbi:hypothetical protein [Spongiimicrobium sp. 3-5]|uniref:hypothetical protein n=1 Tax=Spongiimicrobium sp. 3-5 TaxID=3332596 RepID=UPI0039802B52
MDIFKKDNLVYGILKKLRDVFRPIFDNESLQNTRWNELEINLKPDLIKIKK